MIYLKNEVFKNPNNHLGSNCNVMASHILIGILYNNYKLSIFLDTSPILIIILQNLLFVCLFVERGLISFGMALAAEL